MLNCSNSEVFFSAFLVESLQNGNFDLFTWNFEISEPKYLNLILKYWKKKNVKHWVEKFMFALQKPSCGSHENLNKRQILMAFYEYF